MDEQDAPATRRDLGDLEQRLKREILDGVREMLRGAQTEILDQTQEMVRDAQSEILRAFFPFQEGISTQFRVYSGAIRGVEDRMSIIERRLQEIEKRLLMNPPAA